MGDGRGFRGPGLRRRSFLAATGAGTLGLYPFLRLDPTRVYGYDAEKSEHRALVIAVGETDGAQPLPHAICEAKRFVAWLIDQAGVSRKNIKLLVSPSQKAEDFRGVFPEMASGEAIIKAVEALGDTGMQEHDRIFFFYTGHGAMLAPDTYLGECKEWYHDAIVSADHDWSTRRPISVSWIKRYFEASWGREQFFVIDACRELKGKGQGPARTGKEPILAVNTIRPKLKSEKVQYFMYSTEPGEKAYDRYGGSFANVLLGGLCRGHWGAWKLVPSPPPARYVVAWGTLEQALKSYFQAEKTRVALRNLGGKTDYLTPHVFALPPGRGNYGDGPVLTVLSPVNNSKIPRDLQSTLKIAVEPEAARRGLRIVLSGVLLDQPRELCFDEKQAFVEETLPKGPYVVSAVGGDYKLPRGPFDIYLKEERQQVPVTMIKSVVEFFPRGAGKESGPLRVTFPDKYAKIDVFDSSGRALPGHVEVEDSKKVLTIPNLNSGMYLARVCSRHENVLEKEFQVLASTDHEVAFYRPEEDRTSGPGAFYNLHQDRTTHEHGADEATGPEGRHKTPASGPDWTPYADCPNALLGQVLLATDRPHESWFWKVSQDVGFEKLPDGWVGVRVLAASEDIGDGAESWLKRLRFELLVLDGSNLGHLEATHARPLPRGTPTSLKGFQRNVAPGPYLLRVHHSRGILEIPLIVLQDRRCDIAIYRDAEGHLVLSRYSPRSTGPPRSAEEVRKLSFLQCDLAANEMVAIPDLIESLHGPTMDPIAAVIEAYLSLSSSKDDLKLAAEAEQLVKRYPELPDFSVFKAIVHESDDLAMGVVGTTPKAAAEAYAEALGKGLPIFEGFHKALGNAVRRDPKVGRNAKFFAKLKEHATQTVPDQLWTAWWPTGR